MMPPLSRREHEIVLLALERAARIESESQNPIAASLLRMLAKIVERQQLRGVA